MTGAGLPGFLKCVPECKCVFLGSLGDSGLPRGAVLVLSPVSPAFIPVRSAHPSHQKHLRVSGSGGCDFRAKSRTVRRLSAKCDSANLESVVFAPTETVNACLSSLKVRVVEEAPSVVLKRILLF